MKRTILGALAVYTSLAMIDNYPSYNLRGAVLGINYLI